LIYQFRQEEIFGPDYLQYRQEKQMLYPQTIDEKPFLFVTYNLKEVDSQF